MRGNLMALGVLFLLVPLAAGQETYTLKTSKPEQVGDRAQRSVTENESTVMVIQDATGKVLNEEKSIKQKAFNYVEKILAKESGKRTSKVSRTYQKAVRIEKGQETDVGLKGKTVIIEYKDKSYHFTLQDGGEVTGDAAKFLKEEFKNKDDQEEDQMEKAVLPKKPVQVGESWKCDVAAILKGLGKEVSEGVDAAKVEATGKLLKVYKKAGLPFGVIDVVINLPVKQFGAGTSTIKMDAGVVMKVKATLDACINGSMTEGSMATKVVMKGDGKLDPGDGNLVTLKMDIAFGGTDTRKELK
jgi:hypothetical protein